MAANTWQGPILGILGCRGGPEVLNYVGTLIQVDKKGCVLTAMLLRYNVCSVLNKNLTEFGPLIKLRKKGLFSLFVSVSVII